MADLITPKKVADFLLVESRERGDILTNLKLQKLLYYAQAWFLALRDRELFEEDFQAWVHGPVLPSQYHRFKDYQWSPILSEVERPEIGKNVARHLTNIVDAFGVETASALEMMTHRETPWLAARGDLAPDAPSTNKIKKTHMKKFYRHLGKDK